MDIFKDVREQAYELLEQYNRNQRFKQYLHKGTCSMPCNDCGGNYYRLFEYGKSKPLVGDKNHPHCDCYYDWVKRLLSGTISVKGELAPPDVYLKKYGKLPDYYITKETAMHEYNWNSRRNTLAGVAPGKMIGGIVYNNDKHILPEENGRIWYECDVDYEKGSRSSKRLFYSNDGLMFYSTDHGQTLFYQVI